VPTLASRLLRRLVDRPATTRRAVLLISDQQRNVLPSVCVKSGESTNAAIRVRAVDTRKAELFTMVIGQAATVAIFRFLRRPVETVSLPVSEASWRLWRGRLAVSVLLTAVGSALALVGLLRGINGMVAFGALILCGGWLNRVRAWNNAWVGVELRAARGEVVVSRVHSAFDVEAKAMYSRAMVSRSKRPGR
jgi:hypothetical protein